jgi:ABC-type transport system involved in multi-copper enzyme maturation permease subunit
MAIRPNAETLPEVLPNQGILTQSRSHPLLQVLGWELRRLGANRSTWIMIPAVFAVAFALELFVGRAQSVTIPSADGLRTFALAYTSNWGLYNILPETPGIFLGMYLPFLNVDGVARDLRRRTHELLMSTAIPSWAYVGGRFLSGLLLSLGIACLVLLAIFAQAALAHLVQPDVYLSPDLPGFIAQWALIVLPPTILLGGISFSLGTLWPRSSSIIKLTVMLGWFVSGQMLRWHAVAGVTAQQAAWDPTSESIAYAQTTDTFLRELAAQTYTLSDQAFRAYLHAVEQQLPAMRLWIAPHLLWTLLGFATVLLAILTFRRFRNALS